MLFPPIKINNFHIDNLKYILGLITKISTRSDHFDTHTGMVPLNAEILRKKIRNYKQYLDYALSTGILETDNHYIPGKKSKGYKFSDEYYDKVKSVPIVNYSLMKKNKQEIPYDPVVQAKYPYLSKWFNDNLEIDHTGAVEFIESNYSGDENIYKYNQNLCRIDMLKDHQYYMSVGEKSQRFYTNISGCNKGLRKFIKYAGEELVAVDIRNSQPFMSLILFKPDFYNTNSTSSSFSLYSIYSNPLLYPSTHYYPSLMLYKLLESSNNNDVKLYTELVTNGDLYDYLEKEIKNELGIEYQTIGDLKDEFFKVLYSTNYLINQPYAATKRLFRDRFPTVYKIFKEIKRGNHSQLPILLQQIESFIVLDKVCRRISIERPYLPIYTIHDSIVTTTVNEEYVAVILREELILHIGHKPKLKIEYWKQNT